MIRYARDLKDIVNLYNLKSDSDASKKGEGLKILTNKQMLNHLPTQILYSLYRSKVLTKTVYNNLIKSVHA